jgi:N-acyl homoserine lactone hydrolase
MQIKHRPIVCALISLVVVMAATAADGCSATGHRVELVTLGTPRPASALEAVVDQPGPLTLETVVGADWHVARSGLLNLDHTKA